MILRLWNTDLILAIFFSLLTRSYVLTLRLCQPMSLQGDSDEVLFHIYAS